MVPFGIAHEFGFRKSGVVADFGHVADGELRFDFGPGVVETQFVDGFAIRRAVLDVIVPEI
jgi:hypothetical protein